MNTTIGTYNSHDLALDAILKLKESGHPVSKLTVMGLMTTEQVDEEMHVSDVNPIKPLGLQIGLLAGTTLGILTGVGVFLVPGVGFLFGAGAIIGAIGGFDFGLIGGGLASVLASLGMNNDIAKKYHDALVTGKFLVIAHGNKDEVEKAKETLLALDKHKEVTSF
jgi:hypothetical protein